MSDEKHAICKYAISKFCTCFRQRSKMFQTIFFQFTHGCPDIHRLQPVHMAETHFLLENL